MELLHDGLGEDDPTAEGEFASDSGEDLEGADVHFVNDRSVVYWLLNHGKADAVKRRLSRRKRIELKKCFDTIDTNGSGTIDHSELNDALALLGVDVEPAKKLRGLRGLVRAVDDDTGVGNGEIDFDEFVQIIMAKQFRSNLKATTTDVEGPSFLDIFPLMARAYDVRRTVNASGAKPADPEAEARVQNRFSRMLKDEQAEGRRGSTTGKGQLSVHVDRQAADLAPPSPKSPKQPASEHSARSDVSGTQTPRSAQEAGEEPKRTGVFWDTFSAYSDAYAEYLRYRQGYEKRWYGTSADGAAAAAADENAAGSEGEARPPGGAPAVADAAPPGSSAANAGFGLEPASDDDEEEDAGSYGDLAAADGVGSAAGGSGAKQPPLLMSATSTVDAGGADGLWDSTDSRLPPPKFRITQRRPAVRHRATASGGPAAASAGARTTLSGMPVSTSLHVRTEQPPLQPRIVLARGDELTRPIGREPFAGAIQEVAVPGHPGARALAVHTLGSRGELHAALPARRVPGRGAGSKVLPALEQLGAGAGAPRQRESAYAEAMRASASAGGVRVGAAKYERPGWDERKARHQMHARMQAWRDMRASTLENGPIRSDTIHMGRELHARRRIYLGYTNPLPAADDGVHEFYY